MPVSETYLIDCMEYMAGLPDKFFDLAVVDPPYFSGPDKLGYYGERTSAAGVKRGEYAKAGTWHVPGVEYYNELCRVSKNQIIWGINYFEFAGMVPGRIVWDKVNGESSFSDAELASCSLHDSVRLFSFMWNGMMQGSGIRNGRGRIQQGNKALNQKRIHPTEKPFALYHWIYETYSAPGQKIFDSHMGSQSSRIAAWNMGMDYYGCEIDPKYFCEGNERFEAHRKNNFEQAKLF